jgi:hypothetical protein
MAMQEPTHLVFAEANSSNLLDEAAGRLIDHVENP